MMDEPVIDLAADDAELSSVDDFDDRLFRATGRPDTYRRWAERLGTCPDHAADTIRLAKAVHGVDEPGFYRTVNLLRGTEFAR